MIRHRRTGGWPEGYSLSELVMVTALTMVVGAMAVPALTSALQRVRAEQAARHLGALIRAARTDAVRRRVAVAVVFVRDEGGWAHHTAADGNGNGVRLAEVLSGTDGTLGRWTRLADDFPGVELGVRETVPDLDAAGLVEPGADPVRMGASNLVSCSPDGGCSSGTIYLSGADASAWAVRILGATGRVRLARYSRSQQTWVEP